MIDSELAEIDLDNLLSEIEKEYCRVEAPKVKQAIAEFKAEFPKDWIKERRLEYLNNQKAEVEQEIKTIYQRYVDSLHRDSIYPERALIASHLDELERRYRKVSTEIKMLLNRNLANHEGITQEMIERAREFPFENLIELKRGKALCPFHEDHHPSMGIKNNRYHCFACGASGDTISFVMNREGLSFIEAVKFLAY